MYINVSEKIRVCLSVSHSEFRQILSICHNCIFLNYEIQNIPVMLITTKILHFLLLLLQMWIYLVALLASVSAQSNYDSQSNSIEYNGNGLPETSILDGKVTRLDDIAPVIFLNRTRAGLNCAAGYMQVNEEDLQPCQNTSCKILLTLRISLF